MSDEAIQVVGRIRPEAERLTDDETCISDHNPQIQLLPCGHSKTARVFTLDNVFGPEASQDEAINRRARRVTRDE